MKKSILALATGTFALGIAEFGMMGILGDVATDMHVNIVKAGNLISAYSIGVAIGAPALIFLRKMPLRNLLVLLAALIAIGNSVTALSANFGMMLAGRFIAGLPHGAFFGAGAIVCAQLADKGKGATAVAVMVGGMTVANVVGVPGATLAANLLSWRLAFGIVALCGLLALAGIRFWIPALKPLPDSGGFRGQFRFLKSRAPWLIYAGVFFGQASVYCWLSYIEPIMTRVTGFTMQDMTWIMMIVGAGMVAGNMIAGKASDRFGAALVSAIIATSVVIIMPAIYLMSGIRWASLLLAFIAPAALFGIGGPLQYLIVRFAKGGEMLGGAGIQIAFNTSNAMAAALGGAAIHFGLGLASPALVGAPLAAIGAAALFMLNRKFS